MLDVIKDLSDIGPHPGGSEEEAKIARYLANTFKKYCDKTYFDEFDYIDMNKIEKRSINVIGEFQRESNKKIMICTNIDTIRDYNQVVDLWEKKNKDVSHVPSVPGANEPNSAIAFLIYLAKKLYEEKLLKNVILAGFGAQEDWYASLIESYNSWSLKRLRKKMKRLDYLVGSRHYVLSKGIHDIDSVIAIDAVGIGTPRVISKDSFGSSTLKSDLLKGLDSAKVGGFRIKPGRRSAVLIGCDHLPFRVAGVPSTWIIASRGISSEKNIFGNILNHDNIPNYGTAKDTYENLIKESSNEEIINNFELLSNSLIEYVKERLA
jgi:Zn-dependent M28 family amino/carboxypeptidase